MKKEPKKLESTSKPSNNLVISQYLPIHIYPDGYVSRIPFHPHSEAKILLLGEGDFSFAYSLSKCLQPENIIATSFENSKEALLKKYPNAPINFINDKVEIHFNIDATKLHKYPFARTCTKFVFNFPHNEGGIQDSDVARSVALHQSLLKNFFVSVGKLFSEFKQINSKTKTINYKTTMYPFSEYQNRFQLKHQQPLIGVYKNSAIKPNSSIEYDSYGSEIIIDSSPEILVTLISGEPYDSWDIKRMAREASDLFPCKIVCRETFDFYPQINYPDYSHKKTSGDDRETVITKGKKCKTYVFQIEHSFKLN